MLETAVLNINVARLVQLAVRRRVIYNVNNFYVLCYVFYYVGTNYNIFEDFVRI